MTISLDFLAGACHWQADIVRAEWPNGIPLTDEAADRAAELGLNIEWAAHRLLRGESLAEFERLVNIKRDAYARIQRIVWQETGYGDIWRESGVHFSQIMQPVASWFWHVSARTLLNLLRREHKESDHAD